VELLVVIGVIALLVALLMPVLARARRQADRVVCLSNLRQVGTILFQYVDNVNRGRFPAYRGDEGPERGWVDEEAATRLRPGEDYELLPDTVRLLDQNVPARLLMCPNDPLVRWVWWTYPYSYRMNSEVFYPRRTATSTPTARDSTGRGSATRHRRSC